MKLLHQPLQNRHVRLEPLAEWHREALRGPALADPLTWRYWPRDMLGEGWDSQFDWEIGEQTSRRWMLYAVIAPGERAIGQTCYLDIRPEHGGVEIGGTWYGPEGRGGTINPASKLLLLEHAFACGAERVQLKTDSENARSRAAMMKMGATFEGIHRRHMRRPDGKWRDTAWYVVLREDWPGVV